MKTIIEISNSNSKYFSVASAIEGLIAEALSSLRRNGYTLSFRREASELYCIELDQRIIPASFQVDRFVYFRTSDNPDADRIVYAISLTQGARGYLIDSCFVYSDNISAEMVEKLTIKEVDEAPPLPVTRDGMPIALVDLTF